MKHRLLPLLNSQLLRLSLTTIALAYLYILKDWRDVLMVVLIELSVAKASLYLLLHKFTCTF